jgi:hypothetical protein
MTKPGDNLKFICKFLNENPGSRTKEVREALCRARGINPKLRRGQYTIYFSHLRSGRNYDHLWTTIKGQHFVTIQGMALLA